MCRARPDDWSGQTRGTHGRLDKAWSELVTSNSGDESRQRPREIPRRKKDKGERPLSDLPLFADFSPEPVSDEHVPPAESDVDRVIQFPGLRL